MPSASNCRKGKTNNKSRNQVRKLKTEINKLTKKLAKLLIRGNKNLPGGIQQHNGKNDCKSRYIKLTAHINSLQSRLTK